MDKKLLLFDVDGTLISYDGIVPSSTIEALKKAKQQGHYVFVVTGRTKNRATVGNIEISGMICGNGAYIECEGKILKDQKLSLKQVKTITDYLDNHDLCYFMEGNDGLYGSHDFETRAIPTYQKYGHQGDIKIRDIYPMMEFPESMYQENITKINYILNSYQDYLDFKEHFPQFQCLTWGGQGEDALFGDCALPGIDKRKAIKELIQFLKIDKSNIYAFGDAEVDIPMFQCAGTSICMGSGREAAKQAATYVTDEVKNDGIMKALQHFHLIEKVH